MREDKKGKKRGKCEGKEEVHVNVKLEHEERGKIRDREMIHCVTGNKIYEYRNKQ